MLYETLNPASIRTSFTMDNLNIGLPNEVLVHLYRIAQEFASNILKHSKASEVNCSLVQNQHLLTLCIRDNGIGIGKDVRSGLGMLNMRERAETINAELSIMNNADRGCRLELRVPLT